MSKVWLITGCSRGFGLTLTEQLLQMTDAKIVATARHPEQLQQKFKGHGDRLSVLSLDVTKPSDIKQVIQDTISRFGRIDVLVNNAGYGLYGALEECSMADIHVQYETNVFGLMGMIKATLPHMRSQQSGHIFNFSSVLGFSSYAGVGIYSSTKFAVEGLSEALAGEVAGFGIKVTIIEPGPFRTDFIDSLNFSPEMKAYETSPVHASRERLKGINGQQVGDPKKAAKIIIQLSDMSQPPLRLMLGNPAVDRYWQRQERENAEVLKNESLSRSADFD